MAKVHTPKTPHGPFRSDATAAEALSGLSIIASLAGGVGLIFMAGWFGAGLFAFAFIAVLLASAVGEPTAPGEQAAPPPLTFQRILMYLSAAAVIWAPLVVSATHLIGFTTAGWLAEGLFVGSLLAGLFDQLKGVWKALAALTALAAAAALMLLPAPKAFDDPNNEAAKWRVALQARDSADDPVADALGYCAAFAPWDARPVALDVTQARRSDANGDFEPWSFSEDPKLKTVLCFAEKEEGEDNAGYPLQSTVTVGLTRGVTHSARVTLIENAHPDRAYLIIDAKAETDSPWVQLTLELWDGRPSAPYGVDGYNLIERKGWNLNADGAFALNAQQARGDLFVRAAYRDGQGGAVKLFHIGPVELGSRRNVNIRVTD